MNTEHAPVQGIGAVQALAQQSTIDAISATTCDLMIRSLPCSSVVFYLKDEHDDGLHVVASGGDDTDEDAESVRAMFARGEARFTTMESGLNSMLVPIDDAGISACGALLCLRPEPFTVEDRDTVYHIGLLALSYIALMRARNELERSIVLLAHELMGPLSGIRGALDLIDKELSAQYDFRSVLRHDYFGDILSWTESMTGLVGNATLGRTTAPVPPPIRERTYLMKDVIAPAVRQVDAGIRGRGLPSNRIRYENLEVIPSLWIDKRQFQQLIFNFLSNAVKYAKPDRGTFEVLISAVQTRSGYQLLFQDWGMGIDAGLEEKVFDRGYRAPSARATFGEGLGLWIVRRIVEAHGGVVKVSSLKNPTEFSIDFPKSLGRPPRT